MTTMNNSQTTSIWTALKLGSSSSIKSSITRVKNAAARLLENYPSAIEEGQLYISMPCC